MRVLYAAALIIGVPSPSLGQTAEPMNETAEVCRAFVEAVGADPVNVGECVSARTRGTHNWAAYHCGVLADLDALEFYGYENVGQCIQEVREEGF
jgi:hypothetical protein